MFHKVLQFLTQFVRYVNAKNLHQRRCVYQIINNNYGVQTKRKPDGGITRRYDN